MKRDARPDGALFKRWGHGASPAELKKCVWANTLNAHCLLHLAKQKHGWAGMHKLKQRLLEEYYEYNRNISKAEVLVQIWSVVFPGRDAATEARRHLESRAAEKAVLAQDAKAKARGVSGVPTFKISFCNGAPESKTKKRQWVKLDSMYSGAQSHSTWVRLFLQMQEHAKVTPDR